jgi:predicted Rossmann fold flavoprotein
MKNFDVIVVGGGAAGIMAAGRSAELGKSVLLLEKMNYTGRKLGITGKGRCNITNTNPMDDFLAKVKPNTEFLRTAFSKFYSTEIVEFFNKIGVKTITERGGRVFPESGKAVELVKCYNNWCKSKNVKILNNCRVTELIVKDKVAIGVKAIITENNREKQIEYFAKKIIVTTGGASYPATGSTGDGYKLAKQVGHTVNQIFPALVPIEIDKFIAKPLAGLELKNVKAKVFVNGKLEMEDFGEMNFTDFGMSGPIILSLSRTIVFALINNKKVELAIDLKPALSETKLDNRLIRDLETFKNENYRTILNKLLPRQIIPFFIKSTQIDQSKQASRITAEERLKIRTTLKEIRFKITGYRTFSEAIITAGGIETTEINHETMQSNIIENLFFAGEILDLDAPTGGYNLQIAFSTGWLAGS